MQLGQEAAAGVHEGQRRHQAQRLRHVEGVTGRVVAAGGQGRGVAIALVQVAGQRVHAG